MALSVGIFAYYAIFVNILVIWLKTKHINYVASFTT